MTTAEREELAYNILMEECRNADTADSVKCYYANVMHLDERDRIIARGMVHAYEDGWGNGFEEGYKMH